MYSSLLERAKTFLKARYKKNIWYRLMTSMAVVVVFVTTYMLILPAITMERNTICGMQEHTHIQECYGESGALICGKTEHIHTEACYPQEDMLLEDSGASGNSVISANSGSADDPFLEWVDEGDDSGLIEDPDAELWTAPETETETARELYICGKEEHQHTDACYGKNEAGERVVLICRKEEHIHDASCIRRETEAEPEAEAETEPEVMAEPETETEWEIMIGAETEAEPEIKTETESGTRPVIETETETETEPAVIAFETEAEPETRPETEAVTETEAETETEAATETEAETETEAAAETEAETGTESETETETETEVETETEIETETETETEAETEFAAEPETESEVETETEIETETETETEGETELETESESEIETETESEAAVDSDLHKTGTSWCIVEKNETINPVMSLRRMVRANTMLLSAARGAEVDLSHYVTNVYLGKWENNAWQESTEFTDGDQVKVQIDYAFSASEIGASSVVYYQLPQGVRPNKDESGTVYNNNTPVGTYTIGTDGMIRIEFNESFTATGDGFKGSIFFEGQMSMSGDQDEEEIQFGGTGTTITVKKDKSKLDIHMAKESKITREPAKKDDTATVEYTLTASTNNGTDGTVKIKDQFNSSSVTYDANSFKITKVSKDGSTSEVKAAPTITTETPQSFTIENLPQLEAGEKYVVTYSATVTPTNAGADGYSRVGNTAWASFGDKEEKDNETVTISRSMIGKSGQYNKDTDEISWTITVNEDKKNINGYKLSDVLPGGLTIKGDVTITDNFTNTSETLTGYAGKDRLEYTFEQDTNHTYTFTFKTNAPAENGNIDNHADFGKGEETYGSDTTVGVNHRDWGLNKWAEAESKTGNTGKYTWKAEVTLPTGSLTEFTYTDTIKDHDGKSEGKDHYAYAGELQSKIKETLVLTDGDGNQYSYAYLKDSKEVTLTIVCKNALGQEVDPAENPDAKVTSFTVTVTPAAGSTFVGSKLNFSYPTTADYSQMTEGETWKFFNHAHIPDHDTEVSKEYTYPKKFSKQAGVYQNGWVNYFTGDAAVDMKATDGVICYRLLLRPDATENGDLVITDILPEGMTYVEDSAKGRFLVDNNQEQIQIGSNPYQFLENNQEKIQVKKEVQADGTTKLTFTVPGGYHSDYPSEGRTISVTYQVSVKEDEDWKDLSSEYKTYKNHAEWNNTSAETNTEVDRTVEKVLKTGVQLDTNGNPYKEGEEGSIPSDEAEYTVIINPAGENLDTNSDTLTLTDTMSGSNAFFLFDELKLYQYDSTKPDYRGLEIADSQYHATYDEAAHELTLTLPDKLPCVLVYRYRFTGDGGDMSNAVSLCGKFNSSISTHIKTSVSGSTVTKEDETVKIYKVDKEDYSILLSGAKFTLERRVPTVDKDGKVTNYGEWETVGEVGYLYEAENGCLEFSGTDAGNKENPILKRNVLYRLTEVEAPEEYRRDGRPYYFLCMEKEGFTVSEDAVWEKLGGESFFEYGNKAIPQQIINFFQPSGGQIYIPNTYTGIGVEKVWVDENGSPIPEEKLANKSVQVELRRKVTVTAADGTVTERDEPVPAPRNKENPVTLSSKPDEGWSYYWGNLPEDNLEEKEDESKETYSYYVKELNPDPSCVVEYSNNSGIKDGQITVTNTLITRTETSVTAVKKWYDAEGNEVKDSAYSGEIAVQLYRTHEPDMELAQLTDEYKVPDTEGCTGSIKLGDSYAKEPGYDNTGWKYTWENLPVRDDDEKLWYYYVKETPPDGYQPVIPENGVLDGPIQIQNHEIEKTQIELKKAWVDGEGKPASAPEGTTQIQVKMWRAQLDGSFEENFAKVTLYHTSRQSSEADKEVVYVKKGGTLILRFKDATYSVVPGTPDQNTNNEPTLHEHRVTINGDATIEYNSHDKNGQIIMAEKEMSWDLPEGSKEYYKTVTVSGNDGWSLLMDDLPREGTNENGEIFTYVYGFDEWNVPAGYKPSCDSTSGTAGGTVTITNTELPRTSISVEKKWVDGEGNLADPPEGTESITAEIWQAELPGTFEENFAKVTLKHANYPSDTNEIYVKKRENLILRFKDATWSSVTYPNGESTTQNTNGVAKVHEYSIPVTDDCTVTFSCHDNSSKEIMPEYEKALGISENQRNDYRSITISGTDDWKATVDLPREGIVDGHYVTYVYGIREINVPSGYKSSCSEVDGIVAGSVTVTNTELLKTNISVKKEWHNNDETDTPPKGTESITAELWRAEVPGSFTDSFTKVKLTIKDNLDNSAGEKFEERVEEYYLRCGSEITLSSEQTGYWWSNVSVDGTSEGELSVVQGETTRQKVIVVDNKDCSISVELRGDHLKLKVGITENSAPLQNETFVKNISLGTGNNWTFSTDKLPLEGINEQGDVVTYVYSIRETSVVPGYTPVYSTTDGIPTGTITVTNESDTPTNAITVLKDWDENGVAYEGEHDDIQVELWKKGGPDTKIGEATLSANGTPKWKHTWENLDAGEYYVKEVSVAGYSTKYIFQNREYSSASAVTLTPGSAMMIQNTRELTEIEVEKVWGDRAEKHTDDEVAMQLYSSTTPPNIGTAAGILQLPDNKTPVGDPVTLGAGKNGDGYSTTGWGYRWSKLPKADAATGTPLYYYIEETQSGNYTPEYTYEYRQDASSSEISKVTVTNQLKNTSITVTKKWFTSEDTEYTEENRDASISFDLHKKRFLNGVEVKDKEEITKYTLSFSESDTKWSMPINDLPLVETIDGVTYTCKYSVTETQVNGNDPEKRYDVTYTNNDGITEGEIIISNKDKKTYVLPETGGPGTQPYTLGGILLTAMASLLMGIKNKRRKEERGSS